MGFRSRSVSTNTFSFSNCSTSAFEFCAVSTGRSDRQSGCQLFETVFVKLESERRDQPVTRMRKTPEKAAKA